MINTENKNTLSFSKKHTLRDIVKENNRKHVEEKKQKYGFDFASDNSTPNLIFIEPILKNEENKNYKTSEEKKLPCEKIFFYDRKFIKKAIKEKFNQSLQKPTEFKLVLD